MTIGCGHVPGLAQHEVRQAELGRLGDEADAAWARGDCRDELCELLSEYADEILDAICEPSRQQEVVSRLCAAGAGGIVEQVRERVREQYEPRDPRPDRYEDCI